MSEAQKRENINVVEIIGELVEFKTDVKTDSKGKNFLAGDAVVKSVVDDQELLTQARVFAYEITKAGTVSKLYKEALAAETLLNKRIRISGELTEGLMEKDGKAIRFNQIAGKFFKEADSKEEDKVTFKYSGFVTRPLYEKTNKEGELICYCIDVGQQNWNASNMINIRFNINPDEVDKISTIESHYTKGKTVSIHGDIKFVSRVEKNEIEVMFGENNIETRVFTDKNYLINGGSIPLEDGAPTTYTDEDLEKLVKAYKENEAAYLEAKLKETVVQPVNKIAAKTKTSSLL